MIINKPSAAAPAFDSPVRMEEMLGNLALIAMILDRSGAVTFCNDHLVRLTGWRREETIGANWFDRFLPASEAGLKAVFLHAITTGEVPKHHANPIVTKFGELRDVYWNNTVLRDEDGNVVGLACVGDDITERVRAEKKAESAFNLNRTMLEASPMGILCYAADGSVVTANSAAARLVGATVEQLKGQNFRRLKSWRRSGLYEAAERALETKREVELEVQFTTSFEKEVWLAFRFVPFEHENKPHLLTLFSDIAERKKAESALKESEQRFRQLAENINEVFYMTDAVSNRMLYVSPAYESIWGRSVKSLMENPASWLYAILPEDRERVARSFAKETLGDYAESYRIERPDGSVRWIQDRAFPIRNAAGQVYRVVGIAEDITGRRDLEEQLRQAQKMESIALLAGGVAHDFNNLLTVINGYSELLVERPELCEGAGDLVKEIHSAGKRAANLTRQLLTFSRKQVAQMQNLNLNATITEVAKMLRRLIGENISLKLELAETLPCVAADPGMIEQVLMNLAVNARDAMRNGGVLRIATTAETLSEEEASAMPGRRAGSFVAITVEDTGCGIPKENLARIFEPFYTTKESGKGTGLGLATVFGIAKLHRGWIEVESERGVGTRFRTFIPVCHEAEIPNGNSPGAIRARGGGETILLVEDDDAVRNFAADALRKYGYEVLLARDGWEAVKVWGARAGAIDLLLTDMIMPRGMTGGALAERLRAKQPKLKVVYSSGYSEELAGHVRGARESTSLLQKPYSLQQLAQTVRECLDLA